MVKGGSVGLGPNAVLSGFGMEVGLQSKSDASAAIAIAARRGLDKVRHIEVRHLWPQAKARKGKIKATKASAEEKVADASAKHLNSKAVRKHERNAQLYHVPGRHELAPLKEE